MKLMKRLSVIIPGYNTPDAWWRRCVGSVKAALGPDDEVVCVDDGSSQRPLALESLAKEDSRVKTVYLEKNMGLPTARNAGLDVA